MTNPLKHRGILLIHILLLFIASMVGACDEHTVYHVFRSVPQEGWEREDTLCFEVSVPDSLACYKLSVEIRNRNSYPYQNIGLSVSYDGGELWKRPADSLEIILADERGIWTGNGWGCLYQQASVVGEIMMEKANQYLFKVAYTLPDEMLPGINDVGIKLER